MIVSPQSQQNSWPHLQVIWLHPSAFCTSDPHFLPWFCSTVYRSNLHAKYHCNGSRSLYCMIRSVILENQDDSDQQRYPAVCSLDLDTNDYLDPSSTLIILDIV